MSNVLESYLISLGFSTDDPSFRKLSGVMAQAERDVTVHASGMTKRILELQGTFIGTFTAISAAIIGTVDKVAMADQGYRLMGMQMLMASDSARKLDMITKGLGADLGQVVWDPELHHRALLMSQDMDRMTAALGPGFEDKMRGIRDIRFEFTRLEMATKFLGMSFAEKLFDKLMPGEAGDKIKRFVDWFEGKIPDIADKLSDYAVPALRQTWEMLKELWHVGESAGLMFTNFIGLLSGDTSIEGAAFSFEKMAKAIGHVGEWMTRFFGWISHAEELLAHFASAAALLLSGKFSDAAKELKAGFADLTGGSGLLLGATAGGTVGGLYGAIHGGIAGATAGSALGPLGTLFGAAGGATLGAMGGTAAGGAIGYTAGKVREWIMPEEHAEPTVEVHPQIQVAPPAEKPAPTPTIPAAHPGMLTRADLISAIDSAADRYNVPRALALAVAQQESGIRQDRTSGKGAIGVMQLMAPTAKDLKVDPFDPLQNIEGGVKYLGQLLERYHGDQGKAIAAYNAGLGKVDRARGLSSLPAETRAYVPNVLRLEQKFERAESDSVARDTAPASDNTAALRMPSWMDRIPAWFGKEPKPYAPAAQPVMARDWTPVIAEMQRPVLPAPQVSNTHQSVSISLGGIYITGAGDGDPRKIQRSVADGVRDALGKQTQFDLAQLAPAWGA